MKLPFEEKKRKILTLREAKSSYGKKPSDRTVEELLESGVICLNKHSGPTSHLVTDYLKRILKLKRAGHGGTLDPAVTGVLPIGLNKATKATEYLLLAGKEYVVSMHIHRPTSKTDIKKTIKEFEGLITQLPPVRSAVKRELRQRNVYHIKVLEIEGQDVLLRICCQAGTYIRKIISDFGDALGVGAHMQQLVRTKAGPFNDREWYTLHDIKDAYELYKEGNEKEIRRIIKPVEFAVSHLAKVWIIDTAVDSLCHGANLNEPGIARIEDPIEEGEVVAIYTLKKELIGVGKMLKESSKIKERDVVIETTKIFMEPGTYPNLKK